MSKLKYKLVADFKEYEKAQDPLLHYGDSWIIAYGDDWYCKVASRGEIRAYINGDIIRGDEIADYYKTDKELSRAEKSGELEISNNNWYEVEFYADLENGTEYLDLMADDCVCFSFDEALDIFNAYIEDDEWGEELKGAIEKARKEQL